MDIRHCVASAGQIAVDGTIAAGSSAMAVRMTSEFYMFSGDNQHTAELVASQLGIDHVQAELLPQDKVRAVTELKARGLQLGMIGDGINDARQLRPRTSAWP